MTLAASIHVTGHETFLERQERAIMLCIYTWLTIFWPLFSIPIFLFVLFHPITWPAGLLYLIWYIADYTTPKRGSRPMNWVKGWRLWKCVAEYLPIEIVKTAELPPDKNYIIAAHPHGIIATSSVLSFCTHGTGIEQKFPDLKVYGVTHPLNFIPPLRRELMTAMGAISCESSSISWVLENSASGVAVGIVPGGVSEMAESAPGLHKLTLLNRKGFIKLALKHGAHLVPMYHFGEQELLLYMPGKWLRKFQLFLKRWKGGFIPLAYGCSTLSIILPGSWASRLPCWLRFGFIPFKRKIVSVVGAPIAVDKNENPSQAEIDALHAEYCKQLRDLFDRHKGEFGAMSEGEQLELV